MPSIGFWEMVLVGVIALFVIGPEGLPSATRQLGKYYGQIRRMADDLRRSLVLEADRIDEEERLRDLRRRRIEAEEARMRREMEVTDTIQPKSQPPHDAPIEATIAEAATPDTPSKAVDIDEPVAGFAPAEWAELPVNVRELLHRRNQS